MEVTVGAGARFHAKEEDWKTSRKSGLRDLVRGGLSLNCQVSKWPPGPTVTCICHPTSPLPTALGSTTQRLWQRYVI